MNNTAKNEKKGGTLSILGRLLKYMFGFYKWELAIVAVCIAINAVAAISSSIFLEVIIDEVVTPGLELGWDAVKETMLTIGLIMAGVFSLGVICSFTYNRIMAYVTQGFLKHLRLEMFNKMQSLPIR